MTGRQNYDEYGKKIHQDLVNHPESVATNLSLAVRASCMFWQSRGLNHNSPSDARQAGFIGIRKCCIFVCVNSFLEYKTNNGNQHLLVRFEEFDPKVFTSLHRTD